MDYVKQKLVEDVAALTRRVEELERREWPKPPEVVAVPTPAAKKKAPATGVSANRKQRQ